MIRVWRIVKARRRAFDGEGARLAGGRWNRAGVPVVYASSTLALAALEVLVHMEPKEAFEGYVAIPADISPSVRIARLTLPDLPRSWRDHPPPPELTDFGARWIQRGEAAVLAVPSAVIPQELNYLLNPRHPAFKQIRVGKPQPFTFDPRLRKE